MTLEYAQITGEIGDTKYLFQVKMATGETLFAPLLVQGGTTAIPSKDWIDANKDKFLAVIGFTGEDYNEPFIMGFLPVKGVDTSSANILERILNNTGKLLDLLKEGKVNTQMGPQPFMTDTQAKIKQCKDENDEILKLIQSVK